MEGRSGGLLQSKVPGYKGKNLIHRTPEDDPGCTAHVIIRKPKIMVFSLCDLIAEKFCTFFCILTGQVQDQTAGRLLLFSVGKKIVDDGVIFCKNAGANGRMPQKRVHLLRSEMPQTVDFLALQETGRNG